MQGLHSFSRNYAMTGWRNGNAVASLNVAQVMEVYAIFSREGVKAYNPEGAFYMLIDLSIVPKPSREIEYTLLQEEHVAVVPGSTFGKMTERMIRISFAVGDKYLLEGAERLCNFIRRHSI